MIHLALGLMGGISAVYIINAVPPKWLAEYGEEPPTEAWKKRLNEAHFMPLFSAVMIWAAYILRNRDIGFLIAGFAAIWLLLMIAVIDYKFMVIPDQFTVALALVGIGLVPYQGSVLNPLFGVVAGAGFFLIAGFLGRLIFKKDAIGFGDIKLMSAVGILGGLRGTLAILTIACISSGLLFGILMITGRIKKDAVKPFAPFIAFAGSIYLLFPYVLFD